MISCKLCGGLGNQLFQIFTTIAYALKNNKPFFFLNTNQLGNGHNGVTIRYTYWDTLFSKMKPFLKDINSIPKMLIIPEENFMYNELPVNKNNIGALLVGYFQSPKYFDVYKNVICKLLGLDVKINTVKQKVSNNLENVISISMHFRFGDYKKYPHIYPLLNTNYYKTALQYILKNMAINEEIPIVVYYFCEIESILEVEKIIYEMKKTIGTSIKFKRVEDELCDWEQMIFMSLCNHNIIANSTFSWWGAYLNSNNDAIVCYPEQWFMPQRYVDTSDLFVNNWTQISID